MQCREDGLSPPPRYTTGRRNRRVSQVPPQLAGSPHPPGDHPIPLPALHAMSPPGSGTPRRAVTPGAGGAPRRGRAWH